MRHPCRRSGSGRRILTVTGSRSRRSRELRSRRPVVNRARKRSDAVVEGIVGHVKGGCGMPPVGYVNILLFGIYPYVCLVVSLIGSLIRFDREPYTWKSDSSEMLRKGQLRLGSNLFHYGVIIVILGHFAGFLAPHWMVDWALDPTQHQLLAMVAGGIAGLSAIIGLTILLHR